MLALSRRKRLAASAASFWHKCVGQHTFYHMVKSIYRTTAEGEYVAAASRRRRRILQAGFFFTI